MTPPRCDTCHRWFRATGEYAWKMIYTGTPPEPFGEVYRCPTCLKEHGPFSPQSGIKPEFSCGTVMPNINSVAENSGRKQQAGD